MDKIKRMILCFMSVVILVFIDQYTKYIAVIKLKDNEPFAIIKNILEFYYLPNGNTGAAFGMLKGHQLLFTIIALLVSALLVFIIYRIPAEKKYNFLIIILLMIISGGVGNMLDRIKQNYVVDFIYFRIIDFPIFNVADMYVSVATVLLIVSILFVYKDEDIKKIEDEVLFFKKRNK